jgi:trehalose 6-phosphate phosphatase
MLPKTAVAQRMPHLFQPSGHAALAAVLRRLPLLAFDFDGTLAPIVATPGQARISQSVSGKLSRLAERLPVAILTGRTVDDVRGRLGFEPHYIVGNHGAEVGPDAREAAAEELDTVRRQLASREEELVRAGITVEDKGLSLALHYRLSRRPQQAQALFQDALRTAQARCRTFPGKMVENVVPAQAPDKNGALHELVADCRATCAIFVGDDFNDEPVFASAPDHWLTIRVGREDPQSQAGFFLDSMAEVGMLLDRMLFHTAAAPSLQAT